MTKLTSQAVPDETIVAINGWNRLNIAFQKEAPVSEAVEHAAG